ncbi:MAG: response regulator transcription factor [Rhodomicrobiaceae bacterium]
MSITVSQARHLHRDSETRLPSANISIRAVPLPSSQPCAVVIEPRQLIRDCLARALRQACDHQVIGLSSIEEWLSICERTTAGIVLLSGFDQIGSAGLSMTLQHLAEAKRRVPVVVLSDAEDVGDVVSALNGGIEGYIPTNLSLDVAVEVMRLVRAGGVFVPAGCLNAGQAPVDASLGKRPLAGLFTERQAAVVEALRQGKANKTIAYELNLQESTVKVHIRNIMKKLKARNRTEVAYIVTNLQNHEQVQRT